MLNSVVVRFVEVTLAMRVKSARKIEECIMAGLL
jgi:hypothetical protein